MISLIPLDDAAAMPLYQQIVQGLSQAISQHRLQSGTRLPSTRDLADLLGVSRNTVVTAFDELLAQGYLEARVGDGTYVAADWPHVTPLVVAERDGTRLRLSQQGQLSRLGEALHHNSGWFQDGPHFNSESQALFAVGSPAVEAFPFELWARITAKQVRQIEVDTLRSGQNPAGYWPLRQAIADYLRAARAVNCTPEQIIIVAGAQQALYLATHILLNAGDHTWIEEPGYPIARWTLELREARVTPVPVDDQGIQVKVGIQQAPQARLVYTTPSHQYPTGHILSLARRRALLDWAETQSAWIIEDDYDSAFRYGGPPLPSLQGLDKAGRVIYLGTFSKVLFPGLRLGYMVVPPELAPALVVARSLMDTHPPTLTQLTLTEFMTDGHFTRHIRRMRTLYARRRAALQEALAEYLGNCIQIGPTDAGMHLVIYLPEGVDDRVVVSYAAANHLHLTPLSNFYLGSARRNGLILGYTNGTPSQIREGVIQIAAAIRDVMNKGNKA